MIFIRNTIIVLLLLCLAAISVVGIMVEAPHVYNFAPDRINALGRSVLTVMRPGLLLFLTWVVIFLGTMLVFLITIARPRRRMKIEVQMGGGRVVIMDGAIKKYIRNALSEIGEITVKKIDLRESRNLVTTDIYADVRTRENLPTLERRIISRVRSALAEDLGITNLGDVHVYIRNFEVTGRPIQPAPAPAKQPETESTTDNRLPVEPVLAGGAVAAASAAPDAASNARDESLTLPGESAALAPEPEGEVVFTDSGMMGTEPQDTHTEIVAEKALPAQTDSLPHADDIDEPMPWGIYETPKLADEQEADKDKPAL